MEDLTNTSDSQAFSARDGRHGLMGTTPQVIPGHLAADRNQALLSPAP